MPRAAHSSCARQPRCTWLRPALLDDVQLLQGDALRVYGAHLLDHCAFCGIAEWGWRIQIAKRVP
eukprot:13691714-Alexandrium_andersonii.AAC.1